MGGGHDDRLVAFGATLSRAKLPTQVLVWKPDQVANAIEWLRDEPWWDGDVHFGSCLKATLGGERGVVYETGGSGIVGFYDFSGRAGKRRNQAFRYMAAGIYRPLKAPISYRGLLDDPRLSPLFRKIQTKTALTDAESVAIGELAGSMPQFVTMPLPEWAQEVDEFFEWDLDKPDPTWASEHELHMRLASSPKLWKKLGFTSAPQIEVWSDDRRSRYDVIRVRDRVVVEVKLRGDQATFRQTVRYLDTLARERREDGWVAHIVVAEWADSALRRAAAQRSDIRLWKCERTVQRERLVSLD